ncbi:MAG: metallophosphatase domain-containing protein [Prevotellaceae bacterium]|jgi:Icc-related predicted phosphoesterase|nr:metallophosphatase domain-containing protein [Prevotellaceae bacterium]
MQIVFLSDTHNQHSALANLPAADMIIHAGDISMAGSAAEVMDFIDWFDSLDYQYKLFIAGNHDYCLDGKARERLQKFLPSNMHYLYNSGVEIEHIKFWGIPFLISCELRIANYRSALENIPRDTDVLITHRPPFGILDKSANIQYGCPDLLQTVQRICPRYHLFGHVHDACGIYKPQNGATFINGAILNENYQLANEPVRFELCD